MDAAPPVKPKRKLARYMRRNPSTAERALWKLLRDHRLERLKFRRQMPLGPYVVDFVCLRHRLIVEVDGPVHELRPDNPAREAWLLEQRFRILRVTSRDVHEKAEDVLSAILDAVKATLTRRGARPHIRQPSAATFSRKGRRPGSGRPTTGMSMGTGLLRRAQPCPFSPCGRS